MDITPEGLLEFFSIDPESRGALMWCAYAWTVANGASASEAIREVSRAAHMPYAAIYAGMKRALAPIFGAEPETLEALGLKPCRTVPALAREIAETLGKGGGDGRS